MQSVTGEKSDLRKECKRLRFDMDKNERKYADESIFKHTVGLLDILKPKEVFCYVSSPLLEVDTMELIKYLFSENVRVAVPKCVDGTRDMRFYYIENFDCLKAGAYGILEPDSLLCETAYPNIGSLCIVPGLSFDLCGTRIGFGKGYYDRFLNNYRGITAGLCYDCCIRERIPHEEHDAVMDYVITENGCIFIGNKRG